MKRRLNSRMNQMMSCRMEVRNVRDNAYEHADFDDQANVLTILTCDTTKRRQTVEPLQTWFLGA